MLRSHLRSAFRSLIGRKIPSLVNIFSLSISAFASLVLGSEILSQLNYDDFHEKGDRIYRVVGRLRRDGGVYDDSRTGPPMAQLIKSGFPEVQETASLAMWGGTVRVGEKTLNQMVHFADASFLEIFTFPFTKGNPSVALRDPFSVVITEEAAVRFFGDRDPIGQVLTYTSSVDHVARDFTVQGVLKDVPKNSHIRFQVLASLSSLQHLPGWGDSYFAKKWFWSPTWTYLLTRHPLESVSQFSTRLSELVAAQGERTKRWASVRVEPLEDIHLYSTAGRTGSGDPGGVWIVPSMMFFVGFILLVACLNFTSMATANAADRSREIGLRKALGCSKRQMIGQHLTESLLQSAIAVFLVILLTQVTAEFMGKGAGGALADVKLWAGAVAVVVVTGLAAGIYPALFFSAMQSPQALTGRMKYASVGQLKRVFTVLQFCGSAIAIITTLVLYEQLEAFRAEDLGFNPSGVISIQTEFRDRERVQAFQGALLSDSRVKGVTGSSTLTGLDGGPGYYGIHSPNVERDFTMGALFIGQRFLETMQIGMAEGDYGRIRTLPENAILINQVAREKMGWDLATGNSVELFAGKGEEKRRILGGSIAGVAENFHFRGVISRTIKQPLVMVVSPELCRYLLIRARAAEIPDLITDLETRWSDLFDGQEMAWSRLDWKIDEKYTQLGYAVAGIGAGVILPILLIACVGLFGMTAVTLGARKKDIAIRKAMGASVLDVSTLISSEYVRLVGLSCAISGPIVYFAIRFLGQKVALQNIPQNPLAYAAGFGVVLVVAMLTVNTLAIQAGRANPVDSLRAD